MALSIHLDMFAKLGELFAKVKEKFAISEVTPHGMALEHKILMTWLPIW